MNKRQLARVIGLYRDGVSKEVCITSIIEMSRTNTEASVFICKFFNLMKLEDTKDEPLDRKTITYLENQRPIEDK